MSIKEHTLQSEITRVSLPPMKVLSGILSLTHKISLVTSTTYGMGRWMGSGLIVLRCWDIYIYIYITLSLYIYIYIYIRTYNLQFVGTPESEMVQLPATDDRQFIGHPWGTLLQLEKPPRGQTLRSPRPKVTSVLFGWHDLSNVICPHVCSVMFSVSRIITIRHIIRRYVLLTRLLLCRADWVRTSP